MAFAMHKLYSDFSERREGECRRGEIGCVACKKELLGSMEKPFSEFRLNRERALGGAVDPAVARILEEGSAKARAAAERTLESVRKAMHIR